MKSIKIALALADGVPDVRDQIEEAVRRLNQRAAEENREANVEVVNWCEEKTCSGFFRESPRLLIEKIRSDFTPDIILGVFWGRLGIARQASLINPEDEYKQLAEALAQTNHPRIRLYFIDKNFSPQTSDEREQKDFFLKFRNYFSSESNSLFPYVKESKLGASIYDYLWNIISQSTRTKKQLLELSLSEETWQVIDSVYLDRKRETLDATGQLKPEVAASYFDGESPKWDYVISKSIRPREVVERLEKEISQKALKGRVRVTLLIGPGGEGKSTALQQLAVGLAEHYPDIHVIWRETMSGKVAPLAEALLRQLLQKEGYFVIVSDNAEQIADEVWQSVQFLRQQPRANIQFLLAARTIDWQWAGAHKKEWRRQLGEDNFLAERVNSLNKEDARRVVEAWEDAGPLGLGQFAEIEQGKRVQHLFKLAEEKRLRDREDREGSLLGAMLDARKSATFRDYVKSILGRLEGRTAPGGRTLQKVFAYIVALHADNQQILSRKVLGQLLSCSQDELEREVITPLADEAAADASGWLILARHRTIAEVAREILTKDSHVNFEHQVLPDLLRAAVQLHLAGELDGDEVRPWNYLPDFYARRRQLELAIRLVKIWAEAERDDPFWVVVWSNILRRAGKRYYPEAARVFRQRYHLVSPKKMTKGFYHEWAVSEGLWAISEGLIENLGFDVWLSGIALSDQAREKYEGETPCIMVLSSLSTALLELHKKAFDPHNTAFFDPSNAQVFAMACAAAAQLGFDPSSQKIMRPGFDVDRAKRNLEVGRQFGQTKNIPDVETHEAIKRLLSGIRLAWELRANDDGDMPNSLSGFNELTFGKLYALFKGSVVH